MSMPLLVSRLSRHALPDNHMAPWVQALSCWLLCGCAALICVPELRGFDPMFGWVPFWLVVAPALDLVLLRRRQLLAGTLDLWARIEHRRRTSQPAQRRQRRSRGGRRIRPLARAARARSRVEMGSGGTARPIATWDPRT